MASPMPRRHGAGVRDTAASIRDSRATTCSTLCALWREALDTVCCFSRGNHLGMSMSTPHRAVPVLWSPVLVQHERPLTAPVTASGALGGCPGRADAQHVDGWLCDFLSDAACRADAGASAPPMAARAAAALESTEGGSESGSTMSLSLGLADSADDDEAEDSDEGLWVESVSLVELQAPSDASPVPPATMPISPDHAAKTGTGTRGGGEAEGTELSVAWQIL
mmetsp:Transcript_171329/g.416574  ORF Transcript_171329/g.416574 Transcript_171329/m.416574 type:complete len:223 (-) Transcript_171329:79-747(-)